MPKRQQAEKVPVRNVKMTLNGVLKDEREYGWGNQGSHSKKMQER